MKKQIRLNDSEYTISTDHHYHLLQDGTDLRFVVDKISFSVPTYDEDKVVCGIMEVQILERFLNKFMGFYTFIFEEFGVEYKSNKIYNLNLMREKEVEIFEAILKKDMGKLLDYGILFEKYKGDENETDEV